MPAIRQGLPTSTTGAPCPGAQLAADMAFGQRDRKILDVRLRAPHRSFVLTDLSTLVAHWTTVPVGTAGKQLLSETANTKVGEDTAPLGEVPDPADASVNVRALLVPGVIADSGSHLLKRMQLIAALKGNADDPSCYGGMCRAASDGEMTAALAGFVKSQAGLDLSAVASWHKLLELKYRDRPSTVFFIPALWELPKPPVVKSTTEDSETKFKPKIIDLGQLVSLDVSKSTPRDTLELCHAADALDEFLKREMAHNICEGLRKRMQSTKQAAQAEQRMADERTGRKRKREEEREYRKRKRAEEMEKLREQWQDDDEGLTEEEIAEQHEEREKVLKELQHRHGDEDVQARKREEEEDKLYAKSVGAAKKELIASTELFNSYSYFDRSPGFSSLTGQLPRLRIENVLMCLDDDLTLDEVSELMVIAREHTHPITGTVSYKGLAQIEVDTAN
eukprot:TRINITY_DN47113_c0_g1_i1.p1 TRINITY_DN47113_c0_g1~~TRINITY_DN47113_c0_g1_i1.p1  ORF type:complete len:467 (+),score=130.59 TRINITY_DN47113_c0_g1_i1:57-1403(+)